MRDAVATGSTRAVRRVLAVTNIYPTDSSPDTGTFVQAQVEGLRLMDVDVDVLHIDRRAYGRSAYMRLTSLVRRALCADTYDVVHAMYGGVLAERVVRATAIPSVVSICGSDILGSPTAGLVGRSSAGYGVWASRRATRMADAVIVKSQNLKDALPRDLDWTRVFVIPNGINRRIFRPMNQEQSRAQLGWAPDSCHIVFHHSTDRRKRPELARAGVAWAAERGTRVELHEMANVAHADVPVWLNAGDALLNTALFEGSPNAVKEALACNTAVIGIDVGDIRERVTGVEGCHVVEADPAAIGCAIMAVCSAGRRIDGQAAIEDLSVERVAERVIDVYERAIAK